MTARRRSSTTAAPAAPEAQADLTVIAPPSPPPADPSSVMGGVRRKQKTKQAEGDRPTVALDAAQGQAFNAWGDAAVKAELAADQAARTRADLMPLIMPIFAAESARAGALVASVVLTTDQGTANFVMQKKPKVKGEVGEEETLAGVVGEILAEGGVEGPAAAKAASLFRERRVFEVTDLGKLQVGSADQLTLFYKIMGGIRAVLTDGEWDDFVQEVIMVEPVSDAMSKAVEAFKGQPEDLDRVLRVMNATVSLSDAAFGELASRHVAPTGGHTFTGGGWTARADGNVVTLVQDGAGEKGRQECDNPHHARNLAKMVIDDAARRAQFLREHPVA